MANQEHKPFVPPVPRDHADATFSELVPFRSKKINLLKSPLLIVAVLAAIIVPLLFTAMNRVMTISGQGGSPQQILEALQTFTFAAVFLIVMMIQMLVYMYVRPNRGFWVYMIPFAFAAGALYFPVIFSAYTFIFRTLPIGTPADWQAGIQAGGFRTFYTMLFIAGMCEETLKATPILFGAWLTLRAYNNPASANSPLYKALHVRGPLDGALMGVFAGGGFVLMETGFEYVFTAMNNVLQAGGNIGQATTGALLLLLPRVLGAITGHMAYAGIFGYFIGLAVIRPRQKWKLLAIGFATASLIHAVWNSYASSIPYGYYAVAFISAVGLAAVLLKARQLQMAAGDTGQETTGSIVVDRRAAPAAMPAAPAAMPAAMPAAIPAAMPAAPVAAAPAAAPASAPSAAAADVLVLSVDGMQLPLRPGGRLDLGAEPALGGRGAGVMGSIIPHPTRANVLGLRNEGPSPWTAKLRDGTLQTIANDQSIRLAAGVAIQFTDSLQGAVEKVG